MRQDLLFTRAALQHHGRVRVVHLLIDSGSTCTVLLWEVLLSLTLDPTTFATRRSIMTANGLLVLPEVEVEAFHALGQLVERFPVLAHTFLWEVKWMGVGDEFSSTVCDGVEF